MAIKQDTNSAAMAKANRYREIAAKELNEDTKRA